MPRGKGPSAQANRTDLLKPAAVTTVPDQPYGAQTQQANAQRAIPMAGGQTVTPNQAPAAGQAGQSGGQPGGTPTQPGQPDVAALMQAHAAAGHGPDNHANFTRPTERPGEPVTHGLPGGPGAGPEALTGVGAAARDGAIEQATLGNFIRSLAMQPGASTSLKELDAHAQAGAV